MAEVEVVEAVEAVEVVEAVKVDTRSKSLRKARLGAALTVSADQACERERVGWRPRIITSLMPMTGISSRVRCCHIRGNGALVDTAPADYVSQWCWPRGGARDHLRCPNPPLHPCAPFVV